MGDFGPETTGSRMVSIVVLLKGVDLFRDVRPESLQRLSEHVDLVHFAAGATLVARGQGDPGVFLPLQGTVVQGIGGRVRVLQPGDLVGAELLADGSTVAGDAVARTDVKCLRFEPGALASLLEAEPQVLRKVVGRLASNLLAAGSAGPAKR